MADAEYASKRVMRQHLTVGIIRSLFDYDPKTGFFITKTTLGRCDRWKAGRRAGAALVAGYRSISIQGVACLEHRLAWLYMTGDWPVNEVDHINLDRSDNRWSNLRAASHLENTRNHPGHHSLESGRLKGTTPVKNGRFKAQIMLNRKQHYLGTFPTQEDAHSAYVKASNNLHGLFGRSGITMGAP